MKNEKDIQEYLKKWEHVKLSEDSRARMERELMEYAKFHGAEATKEGVRVLGDGRSIEYAPGGKAFGAVGLFGLTLKRMTALLITIALVGGGTSYAAAGSVPGDLLYPVKVGINENVQSAFAISNESEAALQARLAKERLEEAEELATRGELSAEASAEIGARVRAHYEEATERSNRAEAEGDLESSAEVRAALEGAFRSHADILSELNAGVSGNNGIELITNIRSYADGAANAQATATVDVEASTDASAHVEATVTRAGNFIERVRAKLARAEGDISASTNTRIEAKLTEAARLHGEAQAELRANAHRAAYTAAQAAIRITHEAETMLESALRLGLDLKLNIDGLLGGEVETDTAADADESTEADGTRGNTDTTTEADAGARGSDSDTDVTMDLNASVGADAVDVSIETKTRTNGNLDTSL